MPWGRFKLDEVNRLKYKGEIAYRSSIKGMVVTPTEKFYPTYVTKK